MKSVKHLLNAFGDLRLSEVLRADFWLGAAAGLLSLWWAYRSPAGYEKVAPQLISVVGVIIGSVIAALAVQVAFLDTAFLRKILAIGRSPARYMLPFMFTTMVGIASELSLITFVVVSGGNKLLVASCAGFSTFLAVWTITSLLLCLDTLVQFIELKIEAARVPDDIELSDE